MVSNNLQWDRVNSVFFAVVPDSFMTRDNREIPAKPQSGTEHDAFDIERPIVGHADRWSF